MAVNGGTQLDSQRGVMSQRASAEGQSAPGWIGERTPPQSKRGSGSHHATFADTVAPRVVSKERLDSVTELQGLSSKGNPFES